MDTPVENPEEQCARSRRYSNEHNIRIVLLDNNRAALFTYTAWRSFWIGDIADIAEGLTHKPAYTPRPSKLTKASITSTLLADLNDLEIDV